MSDELFTNKHLKSIGVSSGIAMGRVHLLERGTFSITKRSIKEAQVDREIQRFKHAIQTAIDELKSIRKRSLMMM